MRFVGAGVLVSNFVFFKQKTAYELRISDWSSDVCSSDLLGFAVVIVTIFAHSFSASWWARRLGIDKGKELGVLLIGANGWTNAFGSALKQYGLAVTVADTSKFALRGARKQDLEVHRGAVLDEATQDQLDR